MESGKYSNKYRIKKIVLFCSVQKAWSPDCNMLHSPLPAPPGDPRPLLLPAAPCPLRGPETWSYLSEGKAHVVFRRAGTVLRIRKRVPRGPPRRGDGGSFLRGVLLPCLGPRLLPPAGACRSIALPPGFAEGLRA